MKVLQHSMAVIALFFAAANVQAAIIPLTWTLDSASEVPPISPPVAGLGSGGGSFNTDTNTLTWAFNVQGLTGPAIGAHFHGLGEVGSNAPVLIDLATSAGAGAVIDGIGAADGLYVGWVDLDDGLGLSTTEIFGLLLDQWYVNIHTSANPGGEIRGQIFAAIPDPVAPPVPVPASMWLFGSALAGLGLVRRR